MEKELGPVVAFGKVIRKLRQDKRLSQEQLALESGLDRTYISLLERGLRQPTLTTLFQIATTLGTSPSQIIRMMEESLHEDSEN